MNRGLNKDLKKAFPGLIPIQRPTIENTIVPDPEWFAGFASAESCFFVTIKKSSSHNCGFHVSLTFTLTQHIRDQELIKSFETYLGCGSIFMKWTREVVIFTVQKFSYNMNTIIPFFQKHPIRGVKSKDFEDWCRVGNLMLQGKHLTLEGLKDIRKIKSGMNTKREYS